MNLSKTSKMLMPFFLKKKCVEPVSQTKKTDDILVQLYHDIHEAYQYVNALKINPIIKINQIHHVNQIPTPKMFPSSSFPKEIRDHINDHSMMDLKYTFSLFDRTIHFQFVVEDSNIELHLDLYNRHVKMMLIWMYILNQYSSQSCAKSITVYLYFTRLLKRLPDSKIDILGSAHVNTAFTTTCPSISEIVIFRKEEWFKVFMHETFHNFALDFSDMNNEVCHEKIKAIFPVKSEINLFEAYAEFWAEIMNVCFCSYEEIKDKTDIASFLSHCEALINFERTYGFFQMVKTLHFMGLKYKNLYTKTDQDAILRENLYKEDTSILAYYVIKLILLCNYQDFLQWCSKHNTSLLQFKKTTKNQMEFCQFIEKRYQGKTLLNGVHCAEQFLYDLLNNKNSKRHVDFLLRNMRMTICELG